MRLHLVLYPGSTLVHWHIIIGMFLFLNYGQGATGFIEAGLRSVDGVPMISL